MIIGQQVATASDARESVIDALRRELVGPSPGYPLIQLNGEEILRPQDPPRYRYSCGVLFPQGLTYSASLNAKDDAKGIDEAGEVPEDDGDKNTTEDADDDGSTDANAEIDSEINGASATLPSTMGLSFLADAVGGFEFNITWGTYRKEKVRGYQDHGGNDAQLWFRIPGSASITFSTSQLAQRRHRIAISPSSMHSKLVLDLVVRPWGEGLRLITATLLNETDDTAGINESCFFQCELAVIPGEASSIKPYPGRPAAMQDSEERNMGLLYRHRPNYAVGHGCAADWSVSNGGVTRLATQVLPTFEQAPILPRERLEGVDLSMKVLSEAPPGAVQTNCNALATAYHAWIRERAAELAADTGLSAGLRQAADSNLDECKHCLKRIESGIAVLASDPQAMQAFQMMNRAMLEQREHYRLSVSARTWSEGADGTAILESKYSEPEYPSSTRWRPFQLAFILMNISATVDPSHEDREVVDVIWFPTGGGKTEAYLGLAALTILLRRLRKPENAGTTVLMRYTLRLLTTQQFQRAASLICALERQRRREPDTFGTEPISIGLWLGGAVTPNRNSQAVHELSRLSREGGDNNPFVIMSCPWCGAAMGAQPYARGTRVFGYRLVKGGAGVDDCVAFRCEDHDCDFSTSDGLPLEVVDEGIYARPPTLVIGTVDKFAMMPWEPRSRFLFGIDHPDRVDPPTLVIQDELHLISGPLGSMVGHYETVIDEFCRPRATGTGAKIVASTATIARSSEQILAVYSRSSRLFPPQGLVAGESFFAREGIGEEGRRYVGILATALPSHVTAQVRTLAALLQAPALLSGPDIARDPYWTLMVYFNSLRELGRASTLVQADIREYLNATWDRIGLMEAFMPGKARHHRRFINNFDELTSRLRSGDIPGVLQKLFKELPSKDVVDLCYATNMIQVGLDVPRLSLMSIVGQPKGASEYIQASSRVGRGEKKPGLVVTNFNPFKPRDRSHFESFRPFHESAYRFVEPTSVTPFSIPVCERAVHALAITVARFLFPELRDSPSRGIAVHRDEITQLIQKRVAKVAPGEAARTGAILDRFLDDWERRRPQFYGDMAGGAPDPLMWPAGKPMRPDLAHLGSTLRSTPSSMRNVDAECEAVPAQNYAAENTENDA